MYLKKLFALLLVLLCILSGFAACTEENAEKESVTEETESLLETLLEEIQTYVIFSSDIDPQPDLARYESFLAFLDAEDCIAAFEAYARDVYPTLTMYHQIQALEILLEHPSISTLVLNADNDRYPNLKSMHEDVCNA